MKDSLGIDKTCENCLHWNDGCDFKPSHKRQAGVCLGSVYFAPSNNAMESRILELQAERDKFKAFVQKARNISHKRSAIIALHDEARDLLSRENEVREMNVNFTVFVDKILSGEKRQTIRRASPKWASVKAGDKLTLYAGLHTKQCRKLGEAVVESITPIMIDTECDNVEVETPLGDFNLDLPALNDLVARDGFISNADFFKFFCINYKVGRFKMRVIRWTDFKEAQDETGIN